MAFWRIEMRREILTTAEVTKRRGASVLTIRKWVREGQIPVIRMGGRFIRLDWEEVVALLKAGEEGVK
jgi:excisionase family DNA binding protein